MISKIDFVPGDIIAVHQKIQEDAKTRTQVFEGTVLGIKGRGGNKSFTVRKMVGDVAVERIWPVKSPNIEKVVIKGHVKGKIRQAKPYYLRKTK
ncbi:50S ribosomal protein L19 [Candidatus Microgenomates bacterium]|nr:MAG: 50S ribosomal protein L19 [Candidatus Microgenomates bacterium]